MVFSSVDFLIKFLPVFLAVYYAVPKAWKIPVICAASLVFYTAGSIEEPWAIGLLISSGVINYCAGLGMEKGEKSKKISFALGLIWNIGLLLLFKYGVFICDCLISVFPVLANGPLGTFWVELPLGVSFYTFMMISYLADVHKGMIGAEKNPLRFAAYVLYFPKLTSGPITRYEGFSEQLGTRNVTREQIEEGVRLFVFGLVFKVFLANQLGNLWSDVRTIGFDSVSVALAWMGLAGFSLQLYFDFWGYSLMAMGLARLIGMELPRNFDAPYTSVSMTEFWRRWHMTLGGWFRDYVYIPLGGSRRGRARTILNMLAVWLLTGLWHGADWNFILWGLLLFAVMTVERLGLKDWLDIHRTAGHIYMALLIPLSWMVFAISRLKQLRVYAGRLVGIGAVNVMPGDWLKYGRTYWWLLVLGIIMSTGLPIRIYRIWSKKTWFWLVCAGCAGLATFCIYKGSNDPFMYFRF
ncbi:MAG: MBOAT family protein [Firmicutes bacterium]|nr:MBOAT family protein [Bacillota bacterium]